MTIDTSLLKATVHLIRLPGTSGTHQIMCQRVRKEVSEQNKT